MHSRLFSVGSLFAGTVLAVGAATIPTLLIVLGVAAAACYIAGGIIWYRGRRRSSFQSNTVAQVADPVPAAGPKVQTSKVRGGTTDRIHVTTTVLYLTGLYRGRTSMEADRLAADFKGKWLTVSGSVRDIEVRSDGFRPGAQGRHVMIKSGQRTVFLNFTPEWNERISVLRIDDEIQAVGKIRTITENWVSLDNCERIS